MTPEQRLEEIRTQHADRAPIDCDACFVLEQLDLANQKLDDYRQSINWTHDEVLKINKLINENKFARKQIEILRSGIEAGMEHNYVASGFFTAHGENCFKCRLLKASDDLVPGDEVSDGM